VALKRGTAVLIASADGGCVRARTQASLVELLARADVSEPLDDAALNRAMRSADGGRVLVAAGRTLSGVWAPAVQRAAALAGVTVADLADPAAGVSAAGVSAAGVTAARARA
jgi:hypothetical protein